MSDIDECSSNSSSSSENNVSVPDISSLQPFNFEPELSKEEQELFLPETSNSDCSIKNEESRTGSITVIGVHVEVTASRCKLTRKVFVVVIRTKFQMNFLKVIFIMISIYYQLSISVQFLYIRKIFLSERRFLLISFF